MARPTVTSAAKDNCRHEHGLECHSCGQLGHKEKLCAYYQGFGKEDIAARIIVQHFIDVDARYNNRFSILYLDDDGDNDIPNIELSGNNGIMRIDVRNNVDVCNNIMVCTQSPSR